MLNVLQVGLGPLGLRVASDLHARGLGRIVAALDPAHEVYGRDLAEVLGGDGPGRGVRVRAHPDEIEDWSPIRCAIVTTLSGLEACMETFRALLARGTPIVSTCEELSWPWLRHPVLAQELHELALRHGGRILGTGVNPGFLMDALPVAASTACQRVESVFVERIQDATTRRVPFQRKIGATLTSEAFAARVADGTLRHVGLGESLHLVAHSLGMKVTRWEESIDPVLASERLECGLGPIESGHASGVRQVARGWTTERDGEPALEFVFQATIGEPVPRDRIRLAGDPPLEVLIPGGVHGDTATSAIVLNSCRSLLAAPPGLYTMAELPLRGCATPRSFAPR